MIIIKKQMHKINKITFVCPGEERRLDSTRQVFVVWQYQRSLFSFRFHHCNANVSQNGGRGAEQERERLSLEITCYSIGIFYLIERTICLLSLQSGS